MIEGWCTSCHRLKRVRANGLGMSQMTHGGIPMGLCLLCEEHERIAQGS